MNTVQLQAPSRTHTYTHTHTHTLIHIILEKRKRWIQTRNAINGNQNYNVIVAQTNPLALSIGRLAHYWFSHGSSMGLILNRMLTPLDRRRSLTKRWKCILVKVERCTPDTVRPMQHITYQTIYTCNGPHFPIGYIVNYRGTDCLECELPCNVLFNAIICHRDVSL